MSTFLSPGTSAPPFSLSDYKGMKYSLDDFRGKWLILYFYPKDNTTGCTAEAVAFSDVYDELQKHDVKVIGISPDSPESHKKFIDKHNLKITLLSDETHSVIEAYGVWNLKKMYGKEYMGVERSTFLIDTEGIIREIWKKVKVKGHVNEITAKLNELTGK